MLCMGWYNNKRTLKVGNNEAQTTHAVTRVKRCLPSWNYGVDKNMNGHFQQFIPKKLGLESNASTCIAHCLVFCRPNTRSRRFPGR
ncbi:hypothetical protein PROAA_180003 [Candidatus Propionivibrio aalborgensis]|uniref:Uncharacterized protein n=1 Tax=Candidatus Propionivibrio aalborgensis TaxID=1860101 RepID=A0A1A8XP11_9RHOO|nr:hypothetical protein PROAA_180003 [Candidatus Propionivibrio aalborgensis]